MGRKVNGGALDAIKDVNAALTCMSEDEVVGLGADDIPSIGVWATGSDEVGDCVVLECFNAGSLRTLIDSHVGSLLFNTKDAPI